MNKVFVYGTLKSMYHNNGLLRTAKAMGEAMTKEEYATASAGIPYVINPLTLKPEDEYKTLPVKGEVYEVDDLTLEDLDGLEGHPHWYERHPIEVEMKQGFESEGFVEAWCYLMPSGDNVDDLPTMPINEEGTAYEY